MNSIPTHNRPSAELRRRVGAEHLHRLGARATAEFLSELAVVYGHDEALLERLDRWRRVTPDMVRAAGADRFPATLTVVPR